MEGRPREGRGKMFLAENSEPTGAPTNLIAHVTQRSRTKALARPVKVSPRTETPSRKGTNGVSTNGVTASLCFLTEGLFGYSR